MQTQCGNIYPIFQPKDLFKNVRWWPTTWQPATHFSPKQHNDSGALDTLRRITGPEVIIKIYLKTILRRYSPPNKLPILARASPSTGCSQHPGQNLGSGDTEPSLGNSSQLKICQPVTGQGDSPQVQDTPTNIQPTTAQQIQ